MFRLPSGALSQAVVILLWWPVAIGLWVLWWSLRFTVAVLTVGLVRL